MSWLALLFMLEIGHVTTNLNIGQEVYTYGAYYTTLDGGVSVSGVLDVGGRVDTRFIKGPKYTFIPFDARYTFYANLHRSPIVVGFEHTCYHPVLSADSPEVGRLYGGEEKIYIRVEL